MATSGYKDVTVTSWDTLRFSWWVSSQSIAYNSTTIGWKMELIATGSGRISATSTCPWTVTVNGTQYSGSVNVGISNNSTKTLASGTTTISHASDGSKTFSYSFNQYFGITFSGVWITDKGGSGTGTLPTIPRTSVPTVSVSSVDMGGKVTIYTNRAADTMTHDLAYSFAGSSYVSIATGVGASYTWTTPDLASSIPNAASGTVTIRCITKNGGTTVGTAMVTLTLKVPATVVPTISAVSVTEATDGIAAQFGAYIQSKSTLAVNITAAGVKGSTISEYRATVAGIAYHGAASFTTDVLPAAGDQSVVVTVTDSRGRTASKTVNITVLAYTRPSTSEFKAFRCDENGSPKDDGVYLSVAYSYSVTSLGGKNTADMVIEYKTQAGSSWTTLATGRDLEGSGIRFFYEGPTFSTDYQYDVRMTVTDWFGASTSYAVTLPTADVVLDISSDGKGLAFGKVSQLPDTLEFGRQMRDQFNTMISNGLAVYGGSGDYATDPDTTLEPLILTDKNTPSTNFWYILTHFYSTKSDTAHRTQLALPYQYNRSMYTRVYHAGVWTDWVETPAITDEYDLGIWHIRLWSNGWAELTGSYEISGMACNTGLGNWFRTAVFTPDRFGLNLVDPIVTANYESDGYGALLWATTAATSNTPPSYYLIRPTSTTIATGRIQMRVTGRMT